MFSSKNWIGAKHLATDLISPGCHTIQLSVPVEEVALGQNQNPHHMICFNWCRILWIIHLKPQNWACSPSCRGLVQEPESSVQAQPSTSSALGWRYQLMCTGRDTGAVAPQISLWSQMLQVALSAVRLRTGLYPPASIPGSWGLRARSTAVLLMEKWDSCVIIGSLHLFPRSSSGFPWNCILLVTLKPKSSLRVTVPQNLWNSCDQWGCRSTSWTF